LPLAETSKVYEKGGKRSKEETREMALKFNEKKQRSLQKTGLPFCGGIAMTFTLIERVEGGQV